jgi:hypothetical protein
MADNQFPDDFYFPLILWLWTTCSLIGGQKLSEEATAVRLNSIITPQYAPFENLKSGNDDESPTSNYEEKNMCPKFKALIPGCR